MKPDGLREMIRRGEDSTLEFEREDACAGALAETMAAFLNVEGGVALLGVEDDGRISGATR